MENVGDMAGAEVVQLYIQGRESSITRRIRELKGFKKVFLEPGERRKITFVLGKEELGIWNRNMEFCVESGKVNIFVGGNLTENIQLELKML